MAIHPAMQYVVRPSTCRSSGGFRKSTPVVETDEVVGLDRILEVRAKLRVPAFGDPEVLLGRNLGPQQRRTRDVIAARASDAEVALSRVRSGGSVPAAARPRECVDVHDRRPALLRSF